ncbi:MAG: SDR family NAD(P)-dependent oxidoreductase [Actinomycetota bacterium]
MDLQGRVAVITGGASGIGLATAKGLSERGASLVLADIEKGPLDAAAAELGALGVVCDVSSKASVDALADATFSRFGRADIVFNNAGVAVGGPTVEMTHADWEWLMAVNMWGPIHGVEAFLPRMVEAAKANPGPARGHLLFTSSFAGLTPNVGLGPYCVTKYGVVALAEVLHKELRNDGIAVSVLCPMRVATNIGKSERNRPEEFGGPDDVSHAVLDQNEANEELAGRVLPVEFVADQVLASLFTDRLYIVPHDEARKAVRRRFERIDKAFENPTA